MDPKTLWQKRKWDILFVLFLAYMILVPQNPVRIFLTEMVGKARSTVESFTLDREDRVPLTEKDFQWTLTDASGRQVQLSRFRGKPVLINFWATTCPPCVAELPSLEKLYRDYQVNVHFLFVSYDRSPDRALKFLARKNWLIPVYFPRTNPPAPMQSDVIPTTVILDRNGVMVVKKTAAMDWDASKVRKLLDRLVIQ